MHATRSNAAPPRAGASDDYWALSRRPLNCLLFLAPLLIGYEVGVLWIGGPHTDALRNGADFWMRGWLTGVGIEQAHLLPLLVAGGLLLWQAAGRHPWHISSEAMLGMLAESLLFAFCLVVIGQAQDLVFRQSPVLAVAASASAVPDGAAQKIVTFVGAGIYEEVLFRLCLLPVCFAALRVLLPGKPAAVLAVILTSLAFSAAHYIGPGGDAFSLFTFLFRTLAGLYFAVLFLLRGFGITAGCHAAYDVLVGVLFAGSAG